MPGGWQYEIKKDTKAQFKVLKKLMHDKGVEKPKIILRYR